MKNFDHLATSWDTQEKIDRANQAAAKIIRELPVLKSKTALEIGAGTALLSESLYDFLGDIWVMDTSVKMIEVIEQKIEKKGYSKMHAVHGDLKTMNFNQSFNLIYSLMVLHHVQELGDFFERVSRLQLAADFLITFDLFPEDGSFHNFEAGSHLGFSKDELAMYLSRAGYKQVSYDRALSIRKSNGFEYEVFMSVAQKKNGF